MRKLLGVLFLSLLLVACGGGDDASEPDDTDVTEESATETESDDDQGESTDTDDSDEPVASATGEYERVHDITEITGDDRFIGLGGTIIHMDELDEVIEENDIFKLSAIRQIIFSEDYYIYQLEFELKIEDSVTVAVTDAEVDGTDVTHLVMIDYGQTLGTENFETDYITIYFHNFEDAVSQVDDLKVQLEVSKSGEYETIGESEIVLEF